MAEKRTLPQAIALLESSSSPKRRQGARAIGQGGWVAAGPALLEAYLREREDPRTWETQLEMVRALGLIQCADALPYVREICTRNLVHDGITAAAATAYVRIKRKSPEDASPVLELIELGGFSVLTGAFDALGCDRMVPPSDQITEILAAATPLRHVPGYDDPRYGVAVAAAGWRGEEVAGFLKQCLDSKDEGVVYAAEHALKGKYIRCR